MLWVQTTTGTGAISSNTYVANNTISIGTTTENAQLQLSNSVVNRKIILYESVINNDHQFYGLGVNTSALRYQVDATTSNHVFNAGVNSTTSNELMRLTGLGNLLVGSSAAATARIVATGGIQNIGGEDSCIRAIGSSAATSAKIELQCTNGSGRLYELRSLNNGNLDIVDRSALAGRLTLDTLGNMGLAMQPTGGGSNGFFIGNGAGPAIIPAAGGVLYVNAGRLFYRGSAGTITLLAPA